MTPSIRLARPADADDIFDLIELMYEESGEDSFDPTKVRAQIAALIAGGIVGVAEEDYRIVGTVGLTFAQPWFSSQVRLMDFWTFVHPDYRQSRHAQNLLAFANDSARALGLPLYMGVTANERTEAKCRLFGRKMKKIGELFLGGAV